jgi:hypothetical protein
MNRLTSTEQKRAEWFRLVRNQRKWFGDCMQLIGFNANGNNFHFVRNLTEEELLSSENYIPIFMEAHNRFKLFRILELNYKEWKDYIHLLRRPGQRNYDVDYLQLDRLMLNYLATAYTLQMHFKVSFVRRFKKLPEKLKAYADFIYEMCRNYREFAFFLDFRDHVQHRGLGIGRFSRQVFEEFSEVTVIYDAAQLFAETEDRNWQRCKLTGKEGELNLVEMLDKFHQQMLQVYGSYVATTFAAELMPAAQFYAKLTEEVQKINTTFKMFFGEIVPEENSNPQRANLSLKLIPNDVLTELGLSVSVKN